MRLYHTGDYEPELMDLLGTVLKEGNTAIDVGANIGVVSLWMARCVGKGGRVVSIEPSSWAVDRLRKNALLNPSANITAEQAAAGDRNARMRMSVINGYRVDNTPTNTEEDVAFVTIDLIVEKHGLRKVDLIKIDTDGHEPSVLRGARSTIERFRPTIIFEFGPDVLRRAGNDVSDVTSFMEQQRYSFASETLTPVDLIAAARSMKREDAINIVARPLPM